MSEFVFKLPDLGEGTVESEIAEWFISVGDQVNEEDVVGTMMTDKAAIELSSPVSGKVIKLAGEPGDIVAVGAALVVFEIESAAKDIGTPHESDRPVDGLLQGEAQTNATPAKSNRQTRVLTSPAIRRRAADASIDLALIPGTGPGGRISRKDFDRYINEPAGARSRQAGSRHADDHGHAIPPQDQSSSGTTEIKIIGLRRIIAERMSAATREIPHFTYIEEIDVTELDALRTHLNEKNAGNSEKLTLLPFLGLALIRVLKDFPQCNATYDKERNVLLQHADVHLGIATQTPDGLKVPVVRHAQTRSIDDLAGEMRRVSAAARNNSIGKDELTGSTITITSLGKLGGIASTPIINMPEVGIIGVNRATERPVVLKGQVVVRLMMNLSSSFDHRFVDGYDAAAMIQRIKELLEHPATIFLP
ncbi:MAG: 2-oxo acid dehydrogenase subunit E2 [Proteobacteria bacterium]|nr:2-oxo acid dehydrogenase subunit E2 [Pseudomonadota bacterium]